MPLLKLRISSSATRSDTVFILLIRNTTIIIRMFGSAITFAYGQPDDKKYGMPALCYFGETGVQ